METLPSREERQLLTERNHYVETIEALRVELENAKSVAVNWQQLYDIEVEVRKFWHKEALKRHAVWLTTGLIVGILLGSIISIL